MARSSIGLNPIPVKENLYGINTERDIKPLNYKTSDDPWIDGTSVDRHLSPWEDLILTILANVGRLSCAQMDAITRLFMNEIDAMFKYVNAETNTYYLRFERRLTYHADEQYFSYGFPTDVEYDPGKDFGLACALDVANSISEIKSVSGSDALGDISFIHDGRVYVTKFIDYDHFSAVKNTVTNCVRNASFIVEKMPDITFEECLAKPIFIVPDSDDKDLIIKLFQKPENEVKIPFILAIADFDNNGNYIFKYLTLEA